MVEDDAPIRTVVVDALRDAGYDVAEARDGMAGLAQAARFQPDVVIVDLVMPMMNGYSFVDALRRQDAVRLPNARIIAMSAMARHGPDGVDEFLAKPFNLEDLLSLVALHSGHDAA